MSRNEQRIDKGNSTFEIDSVLAESKFVLFQEHLGLCDLLHSLIKTVKILIKPNVYVFL